MKQLILILCTIALPLSADPTTKPAAPTEIKLTIHPSAIARPALRYRLLPEAKDLVTGNAAVFYLMANQSGFMIHLDDAQDKQLQDWTSADPKDIPRPEADRLVDTHTLREIELGARRDHCSWDFPFRTEGFQTYLPHLSPIRACARLLALKARLQIIDGKYDEAAHTLQTGFALAYHLNQDPCLVQVLVGAGVDMLLLQQVEFWISRPGSPNIYWALADLPQPMCDLRAAFQYERLGTLGSSLFQDALDGKLTGEQLEEMQATLSRISNYTPETAARLKHLAEEVVMIPEAKKYLLDAGYTQTQLDAMKPPALVGLFMARGYDDATQECFKYASLPYWQGAEITDRVGAEQALQPNNPLVNILLPSTRRAAMACVQPQRKAAELQLIEILRAHAAAHGSLPTDLSQLQLPAPIDPATGKALAYSSHDSKVTLDAPIPPQGRERDGRHYIITLSH
jgi:hypothetical protein